MPKLTYTYADISGRGIPARHLLAHAKADYIEESYNYKNSHKNNENSTNPKGHLIKNWPNDKEILQKSNPFVLLPYLKTEENKIISSTLGIMVYLGKRFGYLTSDDDFEILNAFDQAHELREGFIKCVSNENLHALYVDEECYIGPWRNLAVFELKLEQNKTCKYLFSNTTLSITDFYLFSTLTMMFKWHKNVLKNYPNLKIWYENMLGEEGLAEQVEKEKDEPIGGHQDGYDELAVRYKIPMAKDGLFWGVPGKMEAKILK